MEDGLGALRREVERLSDSLDGALLGTLDGKPGLMQTVNNSLAASQANATKLDAVGKQLDGLRLDKAKVTGIVTAVSALWLAFGSAVIALLFRLWK